MYTWSPAWGYGWEKRLPTVCPGSLCIGTWMLIGVVGWCLCSENMLLPSHVAKPKGTWLLCQPPMTVGCPCWGSLEIQWERVQLLLLWWWFCCAYVFKAQMTWNGKAQDYHSWLVPECWVPPSNSFYCLEFRWLMEAVCRQLLRGHSARCKAGSGLVCCGWYFY